MCGLNCNPGVEVNWWEVHENGSGNDLEATWESCILVSSGWNTNFLLKRQMNNHFALWLREAMQTAFCLRVATWQWKRFLLGRIKVVKDCDLPSRRGGKDVQLRQTWWRNCPIDMCKPTLWSMTWTEKAELERTEWEFQPAAATACKLAIVGPSEHFEEKTFGTSGNHRNQTLKNEIQLQDMSDGTG